MKSLRHLNSGDTVDIIAPASRCNVDDLEKVKQFLASWNLKSRIPIDIFGDDLFFANTDEIRFQQLKDALTNTTSKAIWCLRGGYGSMRLIPALHALTPPAQTKIFMGSSDITALHIFLQNEWRWPTLHTPSAHTASVENVAMESLTNLKNLLFGVNTITLQDIKPLNNLATNFSINAPITGGNLCLIQASLATSWQINTQDKILFIEEVNERAYRIDRMLQQLKQANIIAPAKAILLGDLLGGKEPDGSCLIEQAITLFAASCPVPVLQIKGIGHGVVNHPVLLGADVELDNENLKFKL